MTSALQHAFDTSTAAEEPALPVICTVAGPRRPYSSEIYTGAELRVRTLRPGAYDALALPSLFNGQLRNPGSPLAQVSTVWTPPPPAPPAAQAALAPAPRMPAPPRIPVQRPPKPAPAPRVTRAQPPVAAKPGPKAQLPYRPRAGSFPDQVLAHLNANGGHLTYADVCERFGMPRSSATPVFKVAITAGALVHMVIGGRAALALPGYVPLPEEIHPPKGLKSLEGRLAARLEKLGRLQGEIAVLQSRMQTLTGAVA